MFSGCFEIPTANANFLGLPLPTILFDPLCGGGDTQSPQHSFQAGK